MEFDLIVLDTLLGETNGYFYLKKLRHEGFTKPIIVLSEISEPGSDSLALALGANAFVDKMEVPDKLVKTIKKLLGGEVNVREIKK